MDLSASVRLEHELLAVEHEHDVHCMLELVAPEAPAQAERHPLAPSLVVDRSGLDGRSPARRHEGVQLYRVNTPRRTQSF